MIVRGFLAVVVVIVSLVIGAPRAEAAVCRYNVTPDASQGLQALALDVTVDCDQLITADGFRFGYNGNEHVTWRASLPLRYRVALGDLARDRRANDFSATDQGVLAPVDAWLAAPIDQGAIETLEVTFAPSEGVYPLTNLRTSGVRHILSVADWAFGGYTVFASRPPVIVRAAGPAAFDPPGREGRKTAEISVAILDSGFRMTDADFADWIGRFSSLVARFWAGFPTDRLLIAMTSGGRPGSPFGRVRGGGGVTMMMRLSTEETPAFLNERDWVLTHELTHLGVPFARSRTPWFMEGMATYLEPLIRAYGGAQSRQAVWAEWLRMMPTCAAGINMYGLNGRGHAYWTGALYFLLAHVEMSERGQGDGLARCIRAMRGAGDASVRGSVDALIQLCDAAVGAPVMADIQRRFAGPADLDLTKLWERLGVSQSDVGIEFSERGALTRRNLFDPQQFPVPLP